MKPPAYFESVRRRASDRWNQLEADDDLAAPWHQLFRQVQSPRHVLSELLQNADDAGAKKASVSFDGETFVFEHDGADFTEEQFASLCRFGFSNKRSLHTIGFRGIGFKSTFSLGDAVEVLSPSLAVCFQKQRFTEPAWIDAGACAEATIFRVTVTDKNRVGQLHDNLKEWAASPSSLLFFKNLKELRINGVLVRKRVTGRGPVPNSRYLTLAGESSQRLLLVRSEAEALPPEALDELRSERAVEDLHLPPCEVELVLGLHQPQRLYVVLPTGAEMPLPFSINAPFIQDPARMKIKDPATSPTNRWLLERAGRLLADTMLGWIENETLPLEDRAAAYKFLPESTAFLHTLGGQCATAVWGAFNEVVANRPLVLTNAGKVVGKGECVSVPPKLHEIWENKQLRETFAHPHRQHIAAAEITSSAIRTMAQCGWLDSTDEKAVLARLGQSPKPPRPRSWSNLQALWDFVGAKLTYDWQNETLRSLNIVPVDGDRCLHPANDVIRLSSKRDLLSDDDWNFLTANCSIVSPDWIAWLNKLTPKRTENSAPAKQPETLRLLQRLALHEPTPVDRIVAKSAQRLVNPKEMVMADCVRMAQIMAALSARVPDAFHFVTRDGFLRPVEGGIVSDDSGFVETIVDGEWYDEHTLHPEYTRKFVSCTSRQWSEWVASLGCGLHQFVPIAKRQSHLGSRSAVERTAIDRGGRKPASYHYSRNSFTLEDYGFEAGVTKFWEQQAKSDPSLWSRILEAVLKSPPHAWTGKLQATIHHEGNSHRKAVDCGALLAGWIHHFRTLPCLPDTFGNLHPPAELLLHTPETAPLTGIEAFVRADLDTQANRPLLRVFGVRDNPADAGRIIDRLRALSRVPTPTQIVTDIARLYEALDRVVARLAPAPLREIAGIFAGEALVLSDTMEWLTSGEVSIYGDAEAAAPGIHPSVYRLAMWPRIDVPERPAVEKTVEWLQSLDSGRKLEPPELRRVRFALQREPVRIWQSCQHWLALDNTWAAVGSLKYRLTMQGLTKWSELSPAIKKATANLQMLSGHTLNLEPFTQLRSLADSVQPRLTRCVGAVAASLPPWLEELAAGLCRVRLASDDETRRFRLVGQRLRASHWQNVTRIEVTPYVDGEPAGEPATPKAFWDSDQLYVESLPMARLHRDLTDTISRPFAHDAVLEAVAACVDRSGEFVRAFLEECFDLDPEDSFPAPAPPEADVEDPPSGSPPGSSGPTETPPNPTEPPPPNGDGDNEPDADDDPPSGSPPAPEPRRPDSPPSPTLIERYARQSGYRRLQQSDVFVHPDGRRIAKAKHPFQWVEQRADGHIIRQISAIDQRLSRGIEVSYELWQAVKDAPEESGLLLIGEEGTPSLVSGSELIRRKDAGVLTIYPARYRLASGQSSTGETPE